MTLKQKTPMKRSPMSRGTSTLQAKPKADKPPRPKRCKAAQCEGTYLPDARQPWKCWCSDDCAVQIAIAKVEKQEAAKARKDRAETRAKLEAHRKRPYFVAKAQAAFNAFIRERDKDQPCICCGSFAASGESSLHGGGWDAGHYISRGHASHLRFDERNVHKQRKGCNKPGGTTRAKYRIGLVARIGEDAVLALEALEYAESGRGETIEQLKEIAVHYRAKLRELKNNT